MLNGVTMSCRQNISCMGQLPFECTAIAVIFHQQDERKTNTFKTSAAI